MKLILKRPDPRERDMSDPAEVIEQLVGILDTRLDGDAEFQAFCRGLVEIGWTKQKVDNMVRSAIFMSRFGPNQVRGGVRR